MFWLIFIFVLIMILNYNVIEKLNWGKSKVAQGFIAIFIYLLYGVAILIAGYIFFSFM